MSHKVSFCAIAIICIFSQTLVAFDLGYEPGELIVRFLPKATGEQRTIAERNAILAAIGGGMVKDSSKFVSGLTLVKLSKEMSVENAIRAFKNTKDILSAQPNYIYEPFSMFPNDPNFDQLWNMHNTGQTGGTPDADIDAPEAWDIATDTNIIVAVIDSGIDYTHPDLTTNMWINPGEDHPPLGIVGPEDFDGVDDDGNGYIDDIYGYDFSTYGGKERDSDPMDDYHHGTHCAGIIGAVGNNGVGVTGVCWNAKIMALKFISYDSATERWRGYTWDAIDAIRYAVKMGAEVTSNSWGSYYYDSELLAAIEASDANGVLFVAAAGNDYGNNNDTNPFYPASYDLNNIIAVLSTNQYDNMSDFSNYGPSFVDLGAPGEDILSCVPGAVMKPIAAPLWQRRTWQGRAPLCGQSIQHLAIYR